ncbi:conserved hypothetical protein [Ricinus communis]|uniref:Uncharacterized protein n=1 Tax=Ricinus communis TaxID=3988 RepID=B9TNE0_RICCO|nr:conserved hypothetical protein [Ricinus communis]
MRAIRTRRACGPTSCCPRMARSCWATPSSSRRSAPTSTPRCRRPGCCARLMAMCGRSRSTWT